MRAEVRRPEPLGGRPSRSPVEKTVRAESTRTIDSSPRPVLRFEKMNGRSPFGEAVGGGGGGGGGGDGNGVRAWNIEDGPRTARDRCLIADQKVRSGHARTALARYFVPTETSIT